MISVSKLVNVEVRATSYRNPNNVPLDKAPPIRFRMVLCNDHHAQYAAMEPPVCVSLYHKIYPEGVRHRRVLGESELSAWRRLSGMDGWPRVAR